jgi:hypothetical protein
MGSEQLVDIRVMGELLQHQVHNDASNSHFDLEKLE